MGVGKFLRKEDASQDRLYVEPTARKIDADLAALGFSELPTIKKLTTRPNRPGLSYITGEAADLATIQQALHDLRSVLHKDDMAVIYYVGHGNITPDNRDLSLSVYDLPVSLGQGLTVSSVLGILQVQQYVADITQVPQIIIVLDTCYSGTAAQPVTAVIDNHNSLPVVSYSQYQSVAPQIAILSSTSPGARNEAYDLHGRNISAFGYFFDKALGEDWPCADNNSPDGILTFKEIKQYLKRQLSYANAVHETDGLMQPQLFSGSEEVFLAYDPRYHAVNGARLDILEVSVSPAQGEVASISLPSDGPTDTPTTCPGPRQCSFLVSANNTGGVKIALAGTTVTPATGNINTLRKKTTIAGPFGILLGNGTLGSIYAPGGSTNGALGSVDAPEGSTPPVPIPPVYIPVSELAKKGKFVVNGVAVETNAIGR